MFISEKNVSWILFFLKIYFFRVLKKIELKYTTEWKNLSNFRLLNSLFYNEKQWFVPANLWPFLRSFWHFFDVFVLFLTKFFVIFDDYPRRITLLAKMAKILARKLSFLGRFWKVFFFTFLATKTLIIIPKILSILSQTC